MKLNAFRLSTRITVGMLLLVAIGALIWVGIEQHRLHEAYLKERSTDLEAAIQVEQLRLSQAIEALRQDAVFLAAAPPVSGIVRATANRGFDPRERSSYENWEARLQETFVAFLRARPSYFKVRLIGVADGGRELVRVDSRDGRIEVTPRDSLQTEGDRDYFKAGMELTSGRVHLSGFNLNQEFGRIEEPHRPTLRAVTPVFDVNGQVFGLVVINQDVHSLLDFARAGLPPGVQALIADQQGNYLLHPDAKRTFSFESGGRDNITEDFPSLKPMFASQTQNYLPLHTVTENDAEQYLAAKRVYFDAGEPSRFLLLAYHIPAAVAAEQMGDAARLRSIEILLAMSLLGSVLFFMLRRAFSPLQRITHAALEIASGKRVACLHEEGGGEIGELVVALNCMMEKLSNREVVERENTFRKELIESLPGVFYMIDVEGRFLMWNRNLEQVLQRSSEELASSHPLDFFEGEDRVNIEGAIRQVFEQGEASLEAVLMTKDGREMPHHFTGRRIERDGTPVLVGMGLDISVQRESMRVTEALLRRNQRMIATAMDGFWMADAQGFLEEVNESYAKMSGYSMQELVGMNIGQLEAGAQEAGGFDAHIDRLMAQGYDRFETRHRRKDGRVIDIELSATFMPETEKFFVFSHNITQRKQAEQELRVAAATFETHDAILITDAQSNIIRVNRAFTEITGYTAEEVLGKNPRIMSSGKQDRTFYIKMWQQLLHTGSWAGEIWDRRKNGEIYPKWLSITAVKNERQETTQYVAIFSDITERKRIEEEIRNLAFYDTLTQLPNRRLFAERLRAALQASARRRDYGAVLFLDMDRFKMLNDTLGHDCGDLMLVEVANRVRSCVREMDTVARMGGDEFVVLIEAISDDEQDASRKVATVAEKIREALASPYRIKEREHYSSPSIGITLYHGTEEPVEILLRRADLAMYQAKNGGRNAVCFFDPLIQDDVAQHDALEKDLRHAVERGELHLYYQVQVDSAQRPVGAEAMLRWEHPRRGLVMPDQFIPVAEEGALILEIGNWVLDQACAQLARWQGKARMRQWALTVNVSARQFAQPDFAEQVAAAIGRHQIDPARLKLDLTEGAMSSDLAGTVEKMRALRSLGVRLAMADSGAVYSALHYLKQLSSEQIKIHRDVVQSVTEGGNAQLVQVIADLAKNMKLDIFVEGVETEAQFDLLKHHDCKAYQGYLFGKPVPLEELEARVGELPLEG